MKAIITINHSSYLIGDHKKAVELAELLGNAKKIDDRWYNTKEKDNNRVQVFSDEPVEFDLKFSSADVLTEDEFQAIDKLDKPKD